MYFVLLHPTGPLSLEAAALSATLAHAGTGATPVPHWAALIFGIFALWAVIGGGVVALDMFLARFSNR